MEGLGTTVDVVLINGILREGDRIVVCGLGGPIVTRIKSLKTPQVLKEMRVKGALVEHKEVSVCGWVCVGRRVDYTLMQTAGCVT
jgi:translation initiation factor 5B